MLNKIKEFQRQANKLKRDANSVEEFRLWLEADQKMIELNAGIVPSTIKQVDEVYSRFKGAKNDLTKLYHELKGEDAVDLSAVLTSMDKAMEGLETLLQRYA
jgi:hypothetical protein